MPLTTRSAPQRYATIDDLLGDGRSRFFSHGYKSTNPLLRRVRVAHGVSESTLTARAGIAIHGSWSLKGETEQIPHLGTTDVLVLACRMAEAILAGRYSPEILPTAYVESIIVSGGGEPVEGDLSDLESGATLQTGSNGSPSVMRCSVASMTATLTVAHDAHELGLASVQAPTEEALVGDAGSRLYGDRWARRRVSLEDIQLDAEDEAVSAQLSFSQPTPSRIADLSGLEAAYPHALCAVDFFVATLQLGQVLLYGFDSVNRAESNTLWMRKTRIALSRPSPHAEAGRTTGLTVRLRRNRLIEKQDESWRCADVVGTFDGGEVVCSVAHRLPARRATQASEVAR
ncbi:AvrD family protein [Leifsonia shinshuensis]|uniref:Avirulence D protein (AvrD) n=1 Tax=Leifsonia shinshuensis TaxID=150026 RepID=A0A853CSQ4_9MICO|nr:AvrD family protein [Leifsonia shinshuensis]NYJ22943.1 hypothetical protein [Leifsonia shinshuensis]